MADWANSWPRDVQILMGPLKKVTCEQLYLVFSVTFGNSLRSEPKESAMAQKNKLQDAGRTMIILFTVGERNYRMRVARAHVHPGERDLVEMEGKDMLGGTTWTPAPDGGFGPSGEWLVRRALWHVFSDGLKVSNDHLMTVDLGAI